MKDADRKLVDSIKQGDAGAFETLYSMHFARIHNYAASKMRNSADAEDVTQEVFEAVFNCIDRFEGRSDLVVWIYGITRNVIHNRIRRGGSARLLPLEDAELRAAPASQAPDRKVQARRSLERVREVLDALPRDQRRILELRHDDRLAIRRIAELTGRSEDAVKSSLYRTRKALAQRLPDELA